ncbi:MAG TPA: ankyrin repeat domain-containing protein [Gammaproteobacteria bacterium]|nr:ankyrin repeat domain-containing protein [Gammaproteobacteria bacterium]
MKKRLARVIIWAASLAVAGFLLDGIALAGQGVSEKPTFYMTPSDIFLNPQLRQLAEAAQKGNVEKIKTLIADGVNVNGKGKYGITPLYSAVQVGNEAGYKALLDYGADPNVIWTTGDTLMNIIASESPTPYFMRLALEHGGNPNLVAPRTGATPLLAATTVAGKVNIPVLIKAGANLNQQMPVSGETAMMEAVDDFGQFDVVYGLLKAGADYKLQNAQGWDIRDFVQSSFSDSVPADEIKWRDRVIEFLKQHNFWPRISWPHIHANKFLLMPGETYVLNWNKVTGAESYELQLDSHVVKSGLTGTDFVVKAPDVAATVGGLLFWRVRACGTHECSGWSPAATVRVKPTE